VTRAASVLVALACACGGDDTAEISEYSRRQAEIDHAMAEAKAAAARAEAEVIAADGKHWFDLPKAGQLQPGLHECERYLAAMRSYADCAQLPAAARDSIRQTLGSLMAQWRSALSPNGVTIANDGCRLGVESMVDTALMTGCTLDIPP